MRHLQIAGRLLLCLGGLGFVAWAASVCIRQRTEARYEGKPLRFWVAAIYDTGPNAIMRRMRLPDGSMVFVPSPRAPSPRAADPVDPRRVQEALLALGPAAAPDLAKALAIEDTLYARYFPQLLERLPGWVTRGLPNPISSYAVRSRAYSLLVQMGTNAATATPQLAKVAVGRDPYVASLAIELLAQIGDAADGAGPVLFSLLSGPDVERRVSAAKVLGQMPGIASNSIPALRRAWQSRHLPVLSACAALNKLGCHSPEMIPELISLLTREPFDSMPRESQSRRSDSLAVEKPEEAIDPTRTQACQYLGQFGVAAASAAPTLARMLTHSDSRVRAKAAWALGQIGPEAAPMAPALAAAVVLISTFASRRPARSAKSALQEQHQPRQRWNPGCTIEPGRADALSTLCAGFRLRAIVTEGV
ncbi:MAG: HEAT repeat domain-containing protein [Verrucomicrobiota bacterium]